jgi:hypothetical protein
MPERATSSREFPEPSMGVHVFVICLSSCVHSSPQTGCVPPILRPTLTQAPKYTPPMVAEVVPPPPLDRMTPADHHLMRFADHQPVQPLRQQENVKCGRLT